VRSRRAKLLIACLAVLRLGASAAAQTPPPSAGAAPQVVAPKSVRALLELARVQSRQKNLAGALESLRRARESAPNSEEVLSAYAEAALANRMPLRALPVLEALSRLCPTVAPYRYRLGAALLQVGDTEAALLFLKEADSLEPNQAPTLQALGAALDRRGLYAEAQPVLLRGLSLAPDDAETLAALAEAEAALGQLEAARAHAQRALDKASTSPSAHRAMGLLLLKEERYAEARDAFLRAATGPASAQPHDELSRAYAALGDEAAARKHQALFRQQMKEREDRVTEVRRVTGLAVDGPQP